MKETRSNQSYIAVMLLTISAWTLAICSGVALFMLVPPYQERASDLDLQVPGLALMLFDMASMPAQIPFITSIFISFIAVFGLILGWHRRKLVITLALAINIIILLLFSVSAYTMTTLMEGMAAAQS